MNAWATIAGATTGWLIVAVFFIVVLIRKHGSELKMIDQGLADLDNENTRLKDLIEKKDQKIKQTQDWGQQQYIRGQTDLETRILHTDVEHVAEAKSKEIRNLAGDSIHDDMRKGMSV